MSLKSRQPDRIARLACQAHSKTLQTLQTKRKELLSIVETVEILDLPNVDSEEVKGGLLL